MIHSGTGCIALASKEKREKRTFQFPKGERENGESSNRAAAREIQEECGIIRAELVGKLGIYLRKKGKENIRIHMFVGSADGKMIQAPLYPYKCMGWFSLESAKNRMRYDCEADFLEQFEHKIREAIERICSVAK